MKVKGWDRVGCFLRRVAGVASRKCRKDPWRANGFNVSSRGKHARHMVFTCVQSRILRGCIEVEVAHVAQCQALLHERVPCGARSYAYVPYAFVRAHIRIVHVHVRTCQVRTCPCTTVRVCVRSFMRTCPAGRVRPVLPCRCPGARTR